MQPVVTRITNARKDGSHFMNLLAMKPIFDTHGTCRYFLGLQYFLISDEGLDVKRQHLNKLLAILPDSIGDELPSEEYQFTAISGIVYPTMTN